MKSLTIIVVSLFILISSIAGADTLKQTTGSLTLHDQPNVKSKIVDTLKNGQAIIPIYQQGDWLKIANPSNGTVGWVSNQELTQAGFPQISVKTFGQKINGAHNSGYQIIQYNGASPLDEKQMQILLQNLQAQQLQLQNAFSEMLNQNISNFNAFIKQFQQAFPSVYSTNITPPGTDVSTTPAPTPAATTATSSATLKDKNK